VIRPLASQALIIIALLAVALTVFLLDYDQTHGTFLGMLLLAGSAGAAASCLGALLRQGGLTPARDSPGRESWIFPSVTAVAGFAAGAFSLLLALALLAPALTRANSSGNAASAAVFGGIYGLLLGGWAQKLMAAPGVEGTAQALKSAIATRTAGLFAVPVRSRYNGKIGASVRGADGADLVQGILGVRFIPGGAAEKFEPGEQTVQVLVDDGEDAPSADFVVTVVCGPGLDSYPRSRAVSVPVGKASEKFEFTLVREPAEAESADAPSADRGARSALIDVSQAGHTIAVMEVPVPGTREVQALRIREIPIPLLQEVQVTEVQKSDPPQ
jgi:hypothetical protein